MAEYEVSLITKMPEISEDLLSQVNPLNFDLYQAAFGDKGELQDYAAQVRKKLIKIHEERKTINFRMELKL